MLSTHTHTEIVRSSLIIDEKRYNQKRVYVLSEDAPIKSCCLKNCLFSWIGTLPPDAQRNFALPIQNSQSNWQLSAVISIPPRGKQKKFIKKTKLYRRTQWAIASCQLRTKYINSQKAPRSCLIDNTKKEQRVLTQRMIT